MRNKIERTIVCEFQKIAANSFHCLAERLAEGRGSATVATAENNQVPKPSPMRQKPRYLQRLVRPGSGGEAAMSEFALPASVLFGMSSFVMCHQTQARATHPRNAKPM